MLKGPEPVSKMFYPDCVAHFVPNTVVVDGSHAQALMPPIQIINLRDTPDPIRRIALLRSFYLELMVPAFAQFEVGYATSCYTDSLLSIIIVNSWVSVGITTLVDIIHRNNV
jgi:hypothetical protein